MAELKKALKNHPMAHLFDFVQSEKHLYEILPKGVDKGLGLRKLTECLGCDMEKTVAVGDFDNDVSLVKEADIGYAVANAEEVVKEVADRITVPCQDHAIAKIIYEL